MVCIKLNLYHISGLFTNAYLRYFENVDNPYLTKDDVMELKMKTGLQETQIKNWASNKRRKKKENPVSIEILKVLRC